LCKTETTVFLQKQTKVIFANCTPLALRKRIAELDFQGQQLSAPATVPSVPPITTLKSSYVTATSLDKHRHRKQAVEMMMMMMMMMMDELPLAWRESEDCKDM